jgi:hypothetical protein
VRFWIVSALCGLLGLGALKMKSSDENGISPQATIRQPAVERANLTPTDRVL